MKTLPILGAVATATRRKLGTFGALKINNFFLIIALIAYSGAQSGVEPASAYPFLLFLAAILLFPLSSDPLGEVPPSRLALWPIAPRERIALRLASLAVSPILWFLALLLLFRRVRPGVAMAFLTLTVAIQAISALVHFAPQWDARKFTPRFPGAIGILLRSSLRQMFTSLDLWLAVLLAGSSVIYRLSRHPDAAAFPILAILIALCIGNYAQCLFGRDLQSSAITRYHLFPIPGSVILLSKGLACLLVTLVLVAPIQPVAGMTYAFTALAFGHHASVMHRGPMRAWRFSGSRLYIGVAQGVAGIVLAFGAAQRGIAYLAASILIYLISLAIYGRLCNRLRWEHHHL